MEVMEESDPEESLYPFERHTESVFTTGEGGFELASICNVAGNKSFANRSAWKARAHEHRK